MVLDHLLQFLDEILEFKCSLLARFFQSGDDLFTGVLGERPLLELRGKGTVRKGLSKAAKAVKLPVALAGVEGLELLDGLLEILNGLMGQCSLRCKIGGDIRVASQRHRVIFV